MGFKKSLNNQYYVIDNGNVSLKNGEKLSLVYMGTPYGMETPLGYSFVCTRTAFKVQNSSSDAKSNLKLWFYIGNLQVK